MPSKTDNTYRQYHPQVVKVRLQKTASPTHVPGLILFASWRQCTAHLIGLHPSLGPYPSPHPKRILDRFNHFCRARYCNRPTDHATPSWTMGCNNRPHLCNYRDAAYSNINKATIVKRFSSFRLLRCNDVRHCCDLVVSH